MVQEESAKGHLEGTAHKVRGEHDVTETQSKSVSRRERGPLLQGPQQEGRGVATGLGDMEALVTLRE